MHLPLLRPPLPPNALRHRGPGHVESWFLRANHPTRPLALWKKATILAPLDGPPVAEAWFLWFDGERRRTWARRETLPWPQAHFDGADQQPTIRLGETRLALGAPGSSQGRMDGPQGACRWDLAWDLDRGPVAQPLTIYPSRLMLEGPFPKSKVLTPFPDLRFSGRVQVFDEVQPLEGWTGMQGHNFGTEHHYEYAWGQCLFPEGPDGPQTMVEGGSGRLKIGGWVSPRMSVLVVRHGSQELRFDRTFDTWRQVAQVEPWRWTVELKGAQGQVSMTMDAAGMPLACLAYDNPDGHRSYCFNTKLARVWLHVQPLHGPSFQRESPHGGALEFLRHAPDPAIPDIV